MKERGKSKWKSLFKSLLLDNAKQNTSVQATLVFAEIAQLGELIVVHMVIEVFRNSVHPSLYRDVGRSCATSVSMQLVIRCRKPNELAISIHGCNVLDQQVPLEHCELYVFYSIIEWDKTTIALIAPLCSIALIAQIIVEL